MSSTSTRRCCASRCESSSTSSRAKLKSAEYDRLEIVGHTDRIGTEVYNQYLSERRAWAVARYLIQKGVPVTKVAVEGRGMHEPVTAANACAGLTREADDRLPAGSTGAW